MNYTRLLLSALGGLVASFAFGALVMVAVPALFEEAHKYPQVFRPKEQMMQMMPVGLGGNLVSIFIASVIFAMVHAGGATWKEGAIFGAVMGVFVVCVAVMHNYANMNIGGKLAVGQAIAYFFQWIVVGIVIGLIYKPAAS